MMFTGKLKISDKCTHLLEEMAGYTWDSKKQALGEDAPNKINDHVLDSLRYACMRIRHEYGVL
jgi:phage terminase large subunit